MSPVLSPTHTQTRYIPEFIINWDSVNTGTNCQVNTKCQYSLEFCKHLISQKVNSFCTLCGNHSTISGFCLLARSTDEFTTTPVVCQKKIQDCLENFFLNLEKRCSSLFQIKYLEGNTSFLPYVRSITLLIAAFITENL